MNIIRDLRIGLPNRDTSIIKEVCGLLVVAAGVTGLVLSILAMTGHFPLLPAPYTYVVLSGAILFKLLGIILCVVHRRKITSDKNSLDPNTFVNIENNNSKLQEEKKSDTDNDEGSDSKKTSSDNDNKSLPQNNNGKSEPEKSGGGLSDQEIQAQKDKLNKTLPVPKASPVASINNSKSNKPRLVEGRVHILTTKDAGALGDVPAPDMTENVMRTDNKDWKTNPNEMLVRFELAISEKDNSLPLENETDLYLPMCLFINNDNYDDLKKDGDLVEFYYEDKTGKRYHYKLTIDQPSAPGNRHKQPFADYVKTIKLLYSKEQAQPIPLGSTEPIKIWDSPFDIQNTKEKEERAEKLVKRFHSEFKPNLVTHKPRVAETHLFNDRWLVEMAGIDESAVTYYFTPTAFAVYAYKSIPKINCIKLKHGQWVPIDAFVYEYLFISNYPAGMGEADIKNAKKVVKNGVLTIDLVQKPKEAAQAHSNPQGALLSDQEIQDKFSSSEQYGLKYYLKELSKCEYKKSSITAKDNTKYAALLLGNSDKPLIFKSEEARNLAIPPNFFDHDSVVEKCKNIIDTLFLDTNLKNSNPYVQKTVKIDDKWVYLLFYKKENKVVSEPFATSQERDAKIAKLKFEVIYEKDSLYKEKHVLNHMTPEQKELIRKQLLTLKTCKNAYSLDPLRTELGTIYPLYIHEGDSDTITSRYFDSEQAQIQYIEENLKPKKYTPVSWLYYAQVGKPEAFIAEFDKITNDTMLEELLPSDGDTFTFKLDWLYGSHYAWIIRKKEELDRQLTKENVNMSEPLGFIADQTSQIKMQDFTALKDIKKRLLQEKQGMVTFDKAAWVESVTVNNNKIDALCFNSKGTLQVRFFFKEGKAKEFIEDHELAPIQEAPLSEKEVQDKFNPYRLKEKNEQLKKLKEFEYQKFAINTRDIPGTQHYGLLLGNHDKPLIFKTEQDMNRAISPGLSDHESIEKKCKEIIRDKYLKDHLTDSNPYVQQTVKIDGKKIFLLFYKEGNEIVSEPFKTSKERDEKIKKLNFTVIYIEDFRYVEELAIKHMNSAAYEHLFKRELAGLKNCKNDAFMITAVKTENFGMGVVYPVFVYDKKKDAITPYYFDSEKKQKNFVSKNLKSERFSWEVYASENGGNPEAFKLDFDKVTHDKMLEEWLSEEGDAYTFTMDAYYGNISVKHYAWIVRYKGKLIHHFTAKPTDKPVVNVTNQTQITDGMIKEMGLDSLASAKQRLLQEKQSVCTLDKTAWVESVEINNQKIDILCFNAKGSHKIHFFREKDALNRFIRENRLKILNGVSNALSIDDAKPDEPSLIKGIIYLLQPRKKGALVDQKDRALAENVLRIDGKDWKAYKPEIFIRCEMYTDDCGSLPFQAGVDLYLPLPLFINNDNEFKKENDTIEFYYKGKDEQYHYRLIIKQQCADKKDCDKFDTYMDNYIRLYNSKPDPKPEMPTLKVKKGSTTNRFAALADLGDENN